jgi:hypothetical protein
VGIPSQLSDLAELIAEGARARQKRAFHAVFETIEVGLDGEMKKAETEVWFQPLFCNLAVALHGGLESPQTG